ncbi:hypothetical protein Trydic_g5781 [Trypoxylus dichotomus]
MAADNIDATANPVATVESNVKKKAGNKAKKKNSNQKNRKVTINGNGTWMHMDRSVMYMGERALDATKANKKLKNLNRKKQREKGDGVRSTQDPNVDHYLDEGMEIFLPENGHTDVDIVTRFLRIVESQHLLGDNCTAGTDLNLGEGVVDRYAQERFRVEAEIAVNRANMLTRLWKYAPPDVLASEYLFHISVFSMVEFDDDIFAAGNCYDYKQFKNYILFCPYAYRLHDGTILVKDLAVEYKYLSNTSEWFYIARKNAEKVIKNNNQFSRGKYFFLYITSSSKFLI